MTTKERQNVRQAFLGAGFRKDYSADKPEYYDKGDGAYTERWTHFKDNTAITPARRRLKNRWMLPLLLVAATLCTAQAEPRERGNRNYILRRQQIYPGLGVPTSRLIIGRREIDIYRNGMMFERDHLVGIKPR
jgi:hypothetical protein